jgi:hypothetical protein
MKRLLVGVALVFSSVLAVSHAAQQAPPAVPIDNDDIGGVVTGPNGPEAGVWVIASSPTIADALSCRICQRRAIRCGRAATD